MRELEDPIWNKYSDQEKRVLERLPLSIREITGSYKRSKKKQEQISILSQLAGIDKHTIAWIIYKELGEGALPGCWVEKVKCKVITSKIVTTMLESNLGEIDLSIEQREVRMQGLMMELEATEKELQELQQARSEMVKLIKESA